MTTKWLDPKPRKVDRMRASKADGAEFENRVEICQVSFQAHLRVHHYTYPCYNSTDLDRSGKQHFVTNENLKVSNTSTEEAAPVAPQKRISLFCSGQGVGDQ